MRKREVIEALEAAYVELAALRAENIHKWDLFKSEASHAKAMRELNVDLERRLGDPVKLVSLEAGATELLDLIRFLSRTYGDNDPVFVFNNLYGHPLPGNVALARTWFRVVRGWSDDQLESLGDIPLEREGGGMTRPPIEKGNTHE